MNLTLLNGSRAEQTISRPARARSICDCANASFSCRAATPARCMNCATPDVLYWIMFFNKLGQFLRALQPADPPTGHRPVLGEGLNEQDEVAVFAQMLKARCEAVTVVEAAVDLIGDDPDAVLAREFKDAAQLIRGCRPAGRISRGIDADCTGSRSAGVEQAVEIQFPSVVGELQFDELRHRALYECRRPRSLASRVKE